MVWPVAFPLEAFLTRAGITALGTAATSEGIKSLQNQGTVNPGVAKEAFMRTLMGPTTEILNRTTDTPSGKIFAPTGEVIESNQIPGMAPAEQPQGLPGLLPPQQEKQVEGMSQASPPTKDKGFTMPTAEDMSILYKVEDGEPKYKYPTEEEIKKYINEENEFWEQNAQRANEKYPELSSNNLPKLVEADKHFGAAAHSFQDFKNSKLIYMKPQEYLDLTRKFRPAEGEEKLGSKMNVKNIENILQQGKELANIPMLYVKKVGDSFEINGQEGIHRAKAFNNLGYDKIPVVIEGATKKEREELKDFIPSSIQSEDGEVLLTKPEDFYSVIDKKPLVNKDQNLTTKKKPSLTEVDLEEPTTEFTFNEAEVNSFPFNPIDFEKNGILNNPEIIKAFDDLKDDIKIKPPVGFDKDYMVLHQSDSFYVTPPRGQMEITLKYLKKQLEENKASKETVDLIKNLEKDLQAKIKKTGYYGENKEIEDKITNLPGITNKLKKLKGSN